MARPQRLIMGDLTPAVVDRFWSYVDRRSAGECWPWRRGTTPAGYGVFHLAKPKMVGAHRVALTIALGREIGPGLFACHDCDNPPCCNPECLYEGTHQRNVDDKVSRGRQQRGERVPCSRLTVPRVRELRERFARGEYITALALEFGVSLGAASKAVNGLTWAHAGGPVRSVRRAGRRTERERTSA